MKTIMVIFFFFNLISASLASQFFPDFGSALLAFFCVLYLCTTSLACVLSLIGSVWARSRRLLFIIVALTNVVNGFLVFVPAFLWQRGDLWGGLGWGFLICFGLFVLVFSYISVFVVLDGRKKSA